MLGLFLLLVEGLLALLPALHGRPTPPARGDFLLCLGDSVTAGVGLGVGQSWPERLEEHLDVPVLRHAVPGAKIAFAAEEGVGLLEEVPEEATPLVLVMLGHNDEVRFEPGAGNRLRKHRFEELGDPTSGWRGPRLLRLLRWASTEGAVERAGADWLRAACDTHLPPLSEAVEARGGEVVLLTSLVPGAPDALEPEAAALVEEVRSGQAVVNASIRHAAREHQVGLVDLEALVPVGAEWNTEQWLDHIHPSERLTPAMAEAVAEALRAGRSDPSASGGDRGG